eukprot:475774-Pyramimonas_sp.AAC.1
MTVPPPPAPPIDQFLRLSAAPSPTPPPRAVRDDLAAARGRPPPQDSEAHRAPEASEVALG